MNLLWMNRSPRRSQLSTSPRRVRVSFDSGHVVAIGPTMHLDGIPKDTELRELLDRLDRILVESQGLVSTEVLSEGPLLPDLNVETVSPDENPLEAGLPVSSHGSR